jgi:roadblock/LC7 domain-containing protein
MTQDRFSAVSMIKELKAQGYTASEASQWVVDLYHAAERVMYLKAVQKVYGECPIKQGKPKINRTSPNMLVDWQPTKEVSGNSMAYWDYVSKNRQQKESTLANPDQLTSYMTAISNWNSEADKQAKLAEYKASIAQARLKLTVRQAEIVEMYNDGCTDKYIAYKLHLERSSVTRMRQQALTKLKKLCEVL